MLRTFIRAMAIVAAIASLPHITYAESLPGEEAARATIQNQLDAFEARSVQDAYQYAAPNIRQLFPTAEIFGRMVREGYPMVWDPAETEFLEAVPDGETILQYLRLVDRSGQPYIAEYRMVRVGDAWRIAGVVIKRDNSFAA